MSTLKANADIIEVNKFLQKKFSSDIKNLRFIKGGETSQAFIFQIKKKEFVIRVNLQKKGLLKDQYAYKHFNSQKLPIPKITQLGKFNNKLHYAITEKMPGKIINDFTTKEIEKFMPAIIETLNNIHKFPISSNKSGEWDEKGNAHSGNWKEYLMELPVYFDDINNKPILERKIIDKILKTYQELILACPNINHLIHGDPGFDNFLSDGHKITGVIDWEVAKYGDFLYDIAWLSFWENKIDYANIFLKQYNTNNINVVNFSERILCYKLHIGLQALDFYARSEQVDKYDKTKKKILKLVKI